MKFTSAYATLIRKTCTVKSNKIVVGRDARISGEMVKNVVVGTLMDPNAKKVKTGLRQLVKKLAEASAIRASQADSVNLSLIHI